jgi:hypothetical protein
VADGSAQENSQFKNCDLFLDRGNLGKILSDGIRGVLVLKSMIRNKHRLQISCDIPVVKAFDKFCCCFGPWTSLLKKGS